MAGVNTGIYSPLAQRSERIRVLRESIRQIVLAWGILVRNGKSGKPFCSKLEPDSTTEKIHLAKEAQMSTSRLFNVFVALALVVVTALTVHAGIATSEVVSSPKAVLDQHERHPAFANPSAALAEQARLAYRRGEWNAGNSVASPAFDMEQARLSWRASTPVASAQNSTGRTLNQQTRDAIQAWWLAQHAGTNRTCVLLCGGQ
jgi:hypothetical protein